MAVHLNRLERQLKETQAALVSLRALLEHPDASVAVEYRSVRQASALGIAERVTLEGFAAWFAAAFAEIHGALQSPRPEGCRAIGRSL
jgi:hypothetical protein